jgi:hypothetical protein
MAANELPGKRLLLDVHATISAARSGYYSTLTLRGREYDSTLPNQGEPRSNTRASIKGSKMVKKCLAKWANRNDDFACSIYTIWSYNGLRR